MGSRKVLLVGGAGYVGTVLAHRLLEEKFQVRVLDVLIYEHASSLTSFWGNPNFEFVSGDMADPKIREVAARGVTDIVLLGGLVGDPITKKYPEASNLINSLAVTDWIRGAQGLAIEKFILVSTCSNYGLIPDDVLADEKYPLHPLSLYAKAKVAAELALLERAPAYQGAPCVLRFATAFGCSPRMRFDLTLSEFTRTLFLRNSLLVYDPDTWRPYCHVQDLSQAILRVLNAKDALVRNEVFNVGSSENNATKRQIVEVIEKNLGPQKVEYKSQGSDPRNYKVDFQKIESILGFRAQHSIAMGVKELLAGLELGLYKDAEQNRNFYGNFEVRYPR